MLSFEEFKAQRKKEREEASKKASVPATASKSTDSSSQYQEALNQSGTLTFEQFRARQQGGFATQMESSLGSDARLRDDQNRAGQASRVQTPAAKWQADRGALIKELNDIDTYSGWVTDEQQANENEKRRAEILAQLEAGDIAAGIAPESYSEAERGRQIFRGATGQSASGYLSFAGTGLDLLKESALRLGGDINPYAGYATDEVSAAQIGRQPSRRQDFSDTQVYVDKLQSAADRLGESANAELQKAKSGLGKFGQAGVDIAANVLQMGYDAAIGRIPGISSLGSMFIRSAGSGTQQARQQGANVFQQAAYGTVVGGVEVLTEKMFDGVAKIYGAGAADEAVEEAIRKLTKSDFGRTALRWFAGAAGEGIEEVVSDLVAPYAETIYNGENIGDVAKGTFTGDTYDLSEILYDFVIGAAIGGLGGGASVVTGQAAHANRELLERDAGIGDVSGQANDAWEVLTGRRTAEQQAERERTARERLGITESYANDMAAYRTATRGENILEREGAPMEALQEQAEPTEEQKKQNRKEVMRTILDRTAVVAGEELTDEEADALAAVYNAEDGTKGSVYAKTAIEAYQLGKSGKYTLEEAMRTSEQTAQISAEQFRTAFNLGAGVQSAEKVTADVSTQEGKDEVRAAVASLGAYAEEAASVYEEGQDLSTFAAGMNEAAERFAVTGEDVRAQDGGIPAESVISRLSDAQIVKAQEIGAKLREQRAAARQKVTADLKAARALAAELREGGKADIAEIERRISEANKRGAEAQNLFKSQLAALDAAVKADPSYEETEDYTRAYDEAKKSMEAVKEMQRTIRQLEKQKQALEGKQTEKRKKGTVSYNGGNIEGKTYDGVDRENMTRQQKNIAAMAERLADIVNIDYVLFSGPSNMGGAYVQGGVIYININAGMGKGLSKSIAAATLGHELTHFMQEYAPDEYQELKDYVVKAVLKKSPAEFDRLVRQQRRWEPGKTYDELTDELVANACQTMLLNDKAVTQMARENMSLAEKVADVLDDLRAKIAAAFDSVQEENRAVFAAVRAVADDIDGIAERWGKGIAEAVENYNAMQTVQPAGGDSIEIGDVGIAVDSDDGTANVQFSRFTWEESDYVKERDKAARELASKIGVSIAKAKAYIDDVNSVARMIADERVRLDYEDTGLSPFVSNAEYGGSFNMTTLCKKRRLLTGTFSAIQNALKNTALTANEILEIRRMMDEKGLEVSCGKCYVEGSRASMGLFTKEFIKLYKKYHPGAWAPNMAEMNTPDGIEWVRVNHPEVYEQYEYFWNHYGTLRPGDPNLFASQQKPKLYQMRSAYKGEILKHFRNDSSIAEKNKNGGVRVQSFSDFEIVHLIDMMQIITDMSRVGLNGQAYTKVPDFAWALGDTGLKINLSIDAWDVVDGKLVFNNKEGMNFDTAMELRNAYSKNVGTICCVYDDAQLLAALADDRIDFIIPFHRSQWKKSQYKSMGLPATTKDYTYQQNEKWLSPKDHTHEYRGRQVPTRCTNYMPNEYWDFSKSGKENAEEYLRMCARDGKRPKFYRFLTNNGDGSYSLKADGSTDGYWKLLIDFKMYDNEGNGSPQTPVVPKFNMEQASRMLSSYEGGHNTFPVAHGVVDEFVAKYKREHPNQTQFQRFDSDYMDAVERGDMETAQRMVGEAAKAAGYTMLVYRGGGQAHNVFDTNRGGGTTQYGAGTYFTDAYGLAQDWARERAHTEDGNGFIGKYYINTADMFYDKSVDVSTPQWSNVKTILRGFGVSDKKIRYAENWGFAGIANALQSVGLIDDGRFAAFDWKNAQKVNDILRQAGYKGIIGDFYDSKQYVVFDSSLAKSADSVTYDDDGNVIPLSERFNSDTGDIRYQRFDDTTGDTAEERNGRELAYARLQSENAILRETVDELRKLSKKHGKTIEALQKKLSITKTPETRQSDARKLAKALVQEHGSKADVDAIAEELKALGDYILQTETDKLSEDEIKNRARSIARDIVESASEQISIDDGTYSEIADDIKGRKLSIDEAFLGELDQEGGYDRFRKSLFGRLTIAKRESNSRESREGYTSVEQFYTDMQNTYGKAFFPDVANEGEQVQVMVQMLDAGQPMEVNPYEQYMGEASEEIANRIVMDAMSGVLRAQEPTTMDKQRARTKELQERIQQLKAEQKLDQREAANLYRTIYDLSMALDKAESKYKTLRKKASYRAEQVRAEGRARAAEVKAAERERAAEKIDEWKNKYKAEKQAHKETREKINELRQHWRDVKNRERERRSNTAMRRKIAKLVDEINGMLKHPTEKKHVPAHMLRAVVDILEMLDFNTGRGGENMRSKLANLRVMYEGLEKSDAYRDYYTPEVAEMLKNVAEKLGVSYGESEAEDEAVTGKPFAANVYDMTNEQLNDVYRLLRVMVHTINTANKVRIGSEERNAFDLMLGATMDTRGVTKNHAGVFSQHVIPAHLRADVAFEWFGGFKKNSTWKQLARMLNDGQLKQTRLKMELSLPFAELFNNEKALADFTAVNAFGKIDKSKLVDVGLTDEDGNAILIPHDFMVATYLDLLREEGRRHFVRGGLTVPNFEDFYAGKGGYGIGSVRFRGISAELADLNHERSQEMRRLKEELAEAKAATDANAAERVQRIREDMKALRENGEVEALLDAGEKIALMVQRNIEANLTDYDRAWIKATQKLMDEDSKRELNATTMEVYGIEKANSPHYFPIFTDKDFINKPMETIVQDTSLENVGFMKETVKAGNPILAVGTVWAVTRQIDRVAQYCGMMPAIRNFGKVYNKTQSGYNDSMKKALHEVFNKAGPQYVENLIADLSGSKLAKREDMGLSALLGWLRGNLARSTLTLNPRVALAQAASLPTAAAELGYKPIAKALTHAPKDGSGLSNETRDLIAKWTPLMWYRMQGYSSPELGNITGSTKWEDRLFRKMRFITGWIQAIDGATVGRLWYASEYWVQEHKAGLKKGSDAYYEAVAAKFNDVVEKTQPNYTTMQRAAFLRNPGDIAKTFGMFMTQRLQNFNILFSAVGRYQKYRADFTNKRNDVTQADVREARDNVARAVSSQIAQAAMFTCIKVAVDFLLHSTKKYRDKETGDVTVKSVSLAIVDAYLDALMGTVIFGSEVYGIIKAAAGLGTWYGLSLNGIDTINDLCESIMNLRNANVDWDDEKSRKSFYKRVMKVATNGAQALGYPLNNALKIGQAVYYWIEDAATGKFLEAGYERTKAQNTEKMLRALESGDKAAIQAAEEALGGEKDAISAVKTQLKKQFDAGETDAETARRALAGFESISVDDAIITVSQWEWKNSVAGAENISESAIKTYNEKCKAAGIDRETFTSILALKNSTKSEEGVKDSIVQQILPEIDKLSLTASQKNALALCFWSEATVNKYKPW